MTIRVHLLTALPTNNPLAAYGLPPGFPVIVDERQRIIEPVFLFQISSRLVSGGKRNWRENTTLAEAYDLRGWFAYLEQVEWTNPETGEIQKGKPWDVAAETDYINWRDTLEEIISPISSTFLASSTISRGQHAVERFYRHAQLKGWYDGDFVKTKVRKGRDKPLNKAELAERYLGLAPTEASAFREPTEFGEPVRPLTKEQWWAIQKELGPLPSEQANDPRPSRDRLACEFAIGSGVRVDEDASLTVAQINYLYSRWQSLDPEDQEDGYLRHLIKKTKRLKPRNILVPAYLVPELKAYIDGERKKAVAAGKKYARMKGEKFRTPESLFVNHANTGRNAGKPILAASLSVAFKNASIAVGLILRVQKFDCETTEPFEVDVSEHTFHDLRHTFAVWFYRAEVARGNPEPWKDLQILLGHAHMQTTMDIYVTVVSVDRQRAGRKQYYAKKKLGEGSA